MIETIKEMIQTNPNGMAIMIGLILSMIFIALEGRKEEE